MNSTFQIDKTTAHVSKYIEIIQLLLSWFLRYM